MNKQDVQSYVGGMIDDGRTARAALQLAAAHYGWSQYRYTHCRDSYDMPSGLAVTLEWEANDVLIHIVRETKATYMHATGSINGTSPEMVKIAAMWLEDNE